jgi:hypothetical protein
MLANSLHYSTLAKAMLHLLPTPYYQSSTVAKAMLAEPLLSVRDPITVPFAHVHIHALATHTVLDLP